jgi:hypothetical protein
MKDMVSARPARLALIALIAASCQPATASPMKSAASGGSDDPTASVAPAEKPTATDLARPGNIAPPTAPSVAPVRGKVFQAIVEVVTGHRPAYRFRLTTDRLDGDYRIDGDADDGSGPGRLFIDVTHAHGALTLNPCADPDFTQGGDCVQRVLPGGDRLIMRGLVEWDGIRTVVVTLIHPDRSGITAEAGNFSILGQPRPPGAEIVQAGREQPLYTEVELAELVVALDRRLRQIEDR